MKKQLYIITSITVFSALFFNSCRSTDTENSISNGASSVNINLLGTEFSSSSSSAQASLNKGGIDFSTITTQKHSVMVNPSNVIIAELSSSLDGVGTSANASLNMRPVAAVSGNPLTSGMKFRVIAYRSNGNYHTHQDYTVGQTAVPMMLDNGAGYNIVVYSYGTASLPAISSGEQNNISSASVNYDDANRDFMYQKISYTPVNDNNTLNITLRHKVAQITTILQNNTTQYPGNNITSISNATISQHYSNGSFSLNTGSMSGRTASTNAIITFPTPSGTSVTASPIFINNDTGGNLLGTFSAQVQVGSGSVQNILAQNAFRITPETKSNLTINLRTCRAKVSATVTKDFMCHNVGADQSSDPFTPAAAIHGNKYQWGSNSNGKAIFYISQSDDQNNSGSITNWNTVNTTITNWSDGATKGTYDPCPTGYRIPTKDQIDGLINNNTITYIGSNWTSTSTNYSAGIKVGNDLFLPAAGRRSNTDGALSERGSAGRYWTSSIDPNYTYGAIGLLFSNGSISYNGVGYARTNGFSVRCIAQ